MRCWVKASLESAEKSQKLRVTIRTENEKKENFKGWREFHDFYHARIRIQGNIRDNDSGGEFIFDQFDRSRNDTWN